MWILVYEKLVVVGKIFYTITYDEADRDFFRDYERFRKPDRSLLRLRKQVREEVNRIDSPRSCLFFPLNGTLTIPSQTGEKNMSITVNRSQFYHPRFCDTTDDRTPVERYETAHGSHLIFDNQWGDELDYILERPGGFDYVEVDFTKAYWVYGCCRPIRMAARRRILDPSVQQLDIIGMDPEHEELLIEGLDIIERKPLRASRIVSWPKFPEVGRADQMRCREIVTRLSIQVQGRAKKAPKSKADGKLGSVGGRESLYLTTGYWRICGVVSHC